MNDVASANINCFAVKYRLLSGQMPLTAKVVSVQIRHTGQAAVDSRKGSSGLNGYRGNEGRSISTVKPAWISMLDKAEQAELSTPRRSS